MQRPHSAKHRPASPRIETPRPMTPRAPPQAGYDMRRQAQVNRFGATTPVSHNTKAEGHKHQVRGIKTAVVHDAKREFAVPAEAIPAAAAVDMDQALKGLDVGTQRNAKHYFELLCEGVRRDRGTMRSFGVVVDAAMANVRSAARDLPSPNRLTTSAAAMLLNELSYAIGPAYGMLMRNLLNVILTSTYEVSEVATAASSPLPDPELPEPPLSYGELMNTKLYAESNAIVTDTNERLMLRLTEVTASLKACTKQLGRWTNRIASETLGQAFRAWRSQVRERPREQNAWVGVLRQSRFKSIKEVYLLRWKLYSNTCKEQKRIQVSSDNHARLIQRITSVSARCAVREDELQKQRAAKEKFMQKSQHLEDMMAHEKEEAAKAKAKSTSLNTSNAHLLNLCNQMLIALETEQNPVLGGLTPQLVESAAAGNRRGRTAANIGETMLLSRVHRGDDVRVPFHPPAGGCAYHLAQVPNVTAFLLRWVNEMLTSIRNWCDELLVSDAHDTVAVVHHVAEVRAAPTEISNLDTDLSDGRVLLLLHWRLIQAERGPTYTVQKSESDIERCALLIKYASYLGTDGGLTAVQVIKPPSTRTLFHFVCRVFSCSCHTTNGNMVASGLSRGGKYASQLVYESVVNKFKQHQEHAMQARRWQQLAVCVTRHSAMVGDDADDTMNELEVATLTDPVTIHTVRDLLPEVASRFSQPKASDAEEVRGEDIAEEARSFFITEMRSVLSGLVPQLKRAAAHYSACVEKESNTMPAGAIESSGWAKFLSDTKLVSAKVITRSNAEGVFRSLCSQSMGAQAFESASSVSRGGAGSPRGRSGASDEPERWFDPKLMGLAVVKLFLGKNEPNANAQSGGGTKESNAQLLAYTNADEGVEKFRLFVSTFIVLGLTQMPIESVLSPYNTIPVQDLIRQYREPLRKLFNEYARSKDTSGGSRMRVEQFVQIASKETKALEPAESSLLFHAVKHYSISSTQGRAKEEDRASPIMDESGFGAPPATRTPQPQSLDPGSPGLRRPMSRQGADGVDMNDNVGIDFGSFCIAVFALARSKNGFMLTNNKEAVQHFLTTTVFPLYVSRGLKLKW